uniref:Uncharacterized protein n=1 Tax=Solanum lycopersicum TaxID=4081 RepID=K4ATN5_SOLLC
MYTTYKCSPPVTDNTKAILTLNSFENGGNGGGPSECDNQYHSDDTPVVALSIGWYNGGDRCLNYITISANGRSVKAKVVDECDSTMGCDDEHDYQPPCPNNIVDASKAVWEALGIPKGDWAKVYRAVRRRRRSAMETTENYRCRRRRSALSTMREV